jgi:hypothetical protein
MERLWSQLAPRRQAGEIVAVAVDAVRSRRELVLENAVLRHQVNVLRRHSKRPKLHLVDRLKLAVVAAGDRPSPVRDRSALGIALVSGASGGADRGRARRRRCRAKRST